MLCPPGSTSLGRSFSMHTIPHPAELTRRDFSRMLATLTALLMTTPWHRLSGATMATGSPELNDLLLRDALRHSLRNDFNKTNQGLRVVCAMMDGQTLNLAGAAAALDATGRRAIVRANTNLKAALQVVPSGASDLLASYYLTAKQQPSFLRNGFVDRTRDTVINLLADKMGVDAGFRDRIQQASDLVQAFPALGKFGNPAELLPFCSEAVRYLEQNGVNLLKKKLSQTLGDLKAEGRNLVGKTEDAFGQRVAAWKTSADALVRSDLEDAQAAAAICGPLLRSFGVPPADAARMEQFVSTALVLSVFLTGGPLTVPCGATMLNGFSQILGGAAQSDAGQQGIAAVSEMIGRYMREIITQLQSIQASQREILVTLQAFVRESRENQMLILNKITTFSHSIEAKLDILIKTEQQKPWIDFNADTFTLLNSMRTYPDEEKVANYILNQAFRGGKIPALEAMTVSANAFSLDAEKILGPIEDRSDLHLTLRCEFLAQTPTDFDFLPIDHQAPGRKTNPMVWLDYVTNICDVAFLADTEGVLQFSNPKAKLTYLPAIKELLTTGAESGAWYRMVSSPPVTKSISARLLQLARQEGTFDWFGDAVKNATDWFPGYRCTEAYTIVNPLPGLDVLTGDYYFMEIATWLALEGNPIETAKKFGLIKVIETARKEADHAVIRPGDSSGGAFHSQIGGTVHVKVVISSYSIEYVGVSDSFEDVFDELDEFFKAHTYTVERTVDRTGSDNFSLARLDDQDGLFPQLFERLTKLIHFVQLRQSNKRLAFTINGATSLNKMAPATRNNLREWIRTAILGNFALAVYYWRQGHYGVQNVWRDERQKSLVRLAEETPFPFGHDGELIFNFESFAGFDEMLESAYRNFYNGPISLDPTKAASSSTVTYSPPPNPRSFSMSAGEQFGDSVAKFQQKVMQWILTMTAEAFGTGFDDLGTVTIPPIELGLAKLEALRAAVEAG